MSGSMYTWPEFFALAQEQGIIPANPTLQQKVDLVGRWYAVNRQIVERAA